LLSRGAPVDDPPPDPCVSGSSPGRRNAVFLPALSRVTVGAQPAARAGGVGESEGAPAGIVNVHVHGQRFTYHG